jgi:hypothetical protein
VVVNEAVLPKRNSARQSGRYLFGKHECNFTSLRFSIKARLGSAEHNIRHFVALGYFMNRFIIAAVTLASAVSTNAFAQGTEFFGGPYVGVQIGATRLEDKHTDVDDWYNDLRNAQSEKTRVTGGIRAGYDYVSGSLIAGVLAEASFGKVNTYRDFSQNPANPDYSIGSKITALGSVRAKFGVTSGKLAAFATGGVAFANVKDTYRETDGSGQYYDTKGKRTGYVIGLGAAYAVNAHSSIGFDVSNYQFGTKTNVLLAPGGAVETGGSGPGGIARFRQRDRAQSVNVSYNFRF